MNREKDKKVRKSLQVEAWRRIGCACSIVVMMVGCVLLVDSVQRIARSGVAKEAANMMSSSSQEDDLPPGFEEEVLSLEGFTDVRVGAKGTVVGFSSPDPPAELFAALSSRLEERGWQAVSSGSDVCGSFVKEGGAYSWVMVSCVNAGSVTSVVVQCVTNEETG